MVLDCEYLICIGVQKIEIQGVSEFGKEMK